MPAKLTLGEIKQRIYQAHGNQVVLKESSFVSYRQKAIFIDADYGEFLATPKKICSGQGHRKRTAEKMEKTNLQRYGVKNPMMLDEIKQRLRKTNMERYGTGSPLENADVKEKIKKTNIERYGSENVFGSEQIKDKIKKSLLDKYGVDHPLKIDEIKDKVEKTNMERYGVKCFLQKSEIMKEASLEKYGTEYPVQSDIVKDKIKKVNMERYGCENVFGCKEILEKSIQTNLKKYGVKRPAQNLDIARKCARSQTKSIKKTHWKTGKEVVCIASYEAAVVDYLNENKIDYKWQETIFSMPNGKCYIPDCYLVDENKWIEIKGYFRKDAKEKWEWFSSLFRNTELWDRDKLKSMGII